MERELSNGSVDGKHDGGPGEESATTTGEGDRQNSPQRSIVRQAWAFSKTFVAVLWSEAKDRTSPDWPPLWLRILGAILAGVFLAVTVVDLAATILTRISVNLYDIAIASDLAQVTIRPVRSYLDTSASALPFSGDQLFTIWALTGVFLFVSCATGRWRGYLGWAVFGAMSIGMVWSATPAVSQWTAAGLTAGTWSILSVVARATDSRRETSDRSRRTQPGRRSAESRGAATQRRADVQAKILGYSDLATYFASNEKRSIKNVAEDLRLSKTRARDIRQYYLPDAENASRVVALRRKQEIAREYLAGGRTYAEIARKYGVSESSVSRWTKEYKASTPIPENQADDTIDH